MPDRVFYVCSYGGCGSKMLHKYLNSIPGVSAKHLHERNLPTKLSRTSGLYLHSGKLNKEQLENTTVIYIYRTNLIHSIYSRFDNPNHLRNIKVPCDYKLTPHDIAISGEDKYGIIDFYNTYTTSPLTNKKISRRNYDIHCVKYDDFFNNLDEFNRHFSLPPPDKLKTVPIKNETDRTQQMENNKDDVEKLRNIYKDIMLDMEQRPFIDVISGCHV